MYSVSAGRVFVVCWLSQKYFFKKFFQKYQQSVKQLLDPDQTQCCVGQTVCRDYQQMTLAGLSSYQSILRILTFSNSHWNHPHPSKNIHKITTAKKFCYPSHYILYTTDWLCWQLQLSRYLEKWFIIFSPKLLVIVWVHYGFVSPRQIHSGPTL